MSTICGYDRDALIWALTDSDPLNSAEREKAVIVPIGGPIDFSQCVATPKQRAAVCVTDPAKLAELLAEEGRRLGLSCTLFTPGKWAFDKMSEAKRLAFLDDDVVIFIENDNTYVVYTNAVHGRVICMEQARAIFLAWLQLPDGAREEAERVLRGET